MGHDLDYADRPRGNPLVGPRTPATPPVLTHPLHDWLTRACDDLERYDRQAPPAPWQMELLRGTWWVGPSTPRKVAELFARITHGTRRENQATTRIITTARNLVPGLVLVTRDVLRTHAGRAEYVLAGGPACPSCGQVWPCLTLRRAAVPYASWAVGYDPAWQPGR
ncbi:hypothetical protein [Salinispora vitiensis]|uniref:hypothetical protein n=1 Tax=Salinispora vitiensis TaxID=999544 RepID=UPI00036926BE|nr:hypothetical protein [Salinispora vitiensis]